MRRQLVTLSGAAAILLGLSITAAAAARIDAQCVRVNQKISVDICVNEQRSRYLNWGQFVTCMDASFNEVRDWCNVDIKGLSKEGKFKRKFKRR